MEVIKTLRLRIKDKHASVLSAMARDVNTVWNFCNETSARAILDRRTFLSAYDLQKLTTGYSKCDGVTIGSQAVAAVCEEYATRRKQFKKDRLRWRVSNPQSPVRSLGWVPFKGKCLTYRSGQVVYLGHRFSLWDSYGLSAYDFRSGSFSQDARGRWYLNITVKVTARPSTGAGIVGIDLGLKTAATASDGTAVESGTYRKYEAALGLAQRAGKKDRVRAVHAKIANTRKDALHKFSMNLVARHGAIFVGNVSTHAMTRNRRTAKSAHDAGWAMLKTMLSYKSHRAGIVYEEIDEAFTTQTCSCCGAIPAGSPKGRAGLGIRRWSCSDCGAEHDRDFNAAKNIAARGHARLAGGTPTRQGRGDAKSSGRVCSHRPPVAPITLHIGSALA